MTALGTIRVDFIADLAKFVSGVNKASTQLTRFVASTTRTVSSWAGAMAGAVTRVNVLLAGLGVGLGVYQLASSLNAAAAEADRLGKAAKRLDLSVETLSALRFAASEAGTDFEELAAMASKAAKGIASVVASGRSTLRLGEVVVDLTDAEGRVRSIADLLPELARGIQSARSQAEQLRLAERIFGKQGGERFVDLLKESGDFVGHLAEQTERARRLGLIWTEDQVRRLAAYHTAVGRISEAWLGLRVVIMTEIAPALTAFANKLAATVAALPEIIRNAIKLVQEALSGADLYNPAAQNLMLVFDRLARVVEAGALMLVRVGVGAILDAARLALPVIIGSLKAMAVEGAAVVGETIQTIAEELGFHEYAAQMREGIEGMREELISSLTIDLDAAFQMMTKEGSVAADQWVKGMTVLEERVHSLTSLLDELLGISEAVASRIIDSIQTVSDETGNASQGISDLTDRLKLLGEDLRDAIRGWAGDASRSFAELVVDGKTSFDEIRRAWTKTLIAMAADKLVFERLFDAIGNIIGGALGANPVVTTQTKQARGGVWYRGVQAFAHGGVVAGPTYFGMSQGRLGLMGEKGPEAILPLTRVGGDLGVKAAGGVTVNVIDQRRQGARPEVTRSQGPDGRQVISVLIRDEVQRMVADGSLDRPLLSSYGVTRRGAGR